MPRILRGGVIDDLEHVKTLLPTVRVISIHGNSGSRKFSVWWSRHKLYIHDRCRIYVSDRTLYIRQSPKYQWRYETTELTGNFSRVCMVFLKNSHLTVERDAESKNVRELIATQSDCIIVRGAAAAKTLDVIATERSQIQIRPSRQYAEQEFLLDATGHSKIFIETRNTDAPCFKITCLASDSSIIQGIDRIPIPCRQLVSRLCDSSSRALVVSQSNEIA